MDMNKQHNELNGEELFIIDSYTYWRNSNVSLDYKLMQLTHWSKKAEALNIQHLLY